jgi:OOP family OmpA-OmpF porin
MKILRGILAGALLAMLAACGGIPGFGSVEDEMSATQNMATRGSAFDKALHGEYGWVARTYYNKAGVGRHDAARTFNERAATAGRGEKVEPWDPAHVAAANGNTEIHDAYAQLRAALDGGGAQKDPANMAKAQAAFDCWLYSLDPEPEIEAICKERFYAAMAAMAGPPPASNWIVYFDFDSSAVRPDAAQILNDVLGAAGDRTGANVHATGHTDLAGPPAYNLGLSERRSVSVRDYLINGGLAGSRIAIDWRGESDPRTPTPDGTAEQENRRVEIMMQ